MRPKLLTQTMEISETSVLSLRCPPGIWRRDFSYRATLTPCLALSLAPSVGTALLQPPCLTHHHFPFRIQLRHHCPQEDFGSSQSTGETSIRTVQRAGAGPG